MLIQLAHDHGCEIFACHRTAEEGAFCQAIGATHLIDVSTTDYVAAVLQLTGGKGVHFSFNGVGGSTVNTDWKIVAPFGEILLYGYVAGKAALQIFEIARTVAVKTFSAGMISLPSPSTSRARPTRCIADFGTVRCST